MLEVKNLVKTFGNYTAVDHVSFQIPDGKIMGLIGQNGAGKTKEKCYGMVIILGRKIMISSVIFQKNEDFIQK